MALALRPPGIIFLPQPLGLLEGTLTSQPPIPHLSFLCRMIVELHRKVSSLIEFLKQKWALHEVRVVSFSYLKPPPGSAAPAA